MKLAKLWEFMEEKIFTLPSQKGEQPLFNPYRDNDLDYDLPNANKIRRNNLKNYLMSFKKRPRIVLVGEAPGWKGCRFSGVPFSSEDQIGNGILPFKGQRSSNNHKTRPYKEPTATIFWEHMLRHDPKFFAWNCIPLHPYKKEKALSNRTPKAQEVSKYSELLNDILDLIDPEVVIAVGRKAEKSLSQMKIDCHYVRHPSNGGAKEFGDKINRLIEQADSTRKCNG